MDLTAGRTRRSKSLFRPWNSYLAKKGLVDAAAKARALDYARERATKGNAPHFAPIVRLTAGLLDTYEGINKSYYQKKTAKAPRQKSIEMSNKRSDPCIDAILKKPTEPSSSDDVGGVMQSTKTSFGSVGKKKKKKSKTESSPMSVQYCDENFDYIVRTGETFNNRYMLEKVIGRGSFGQVVRAYDTRDNTHVAIKIIKNNRLYVEQALSEVRMTSYLNRIDPEDAHSIMRLRDKFIFRGHQCLVLELLSFSLYDLLRSTEFYGVSLNLVRKFCKQILNCLAFLARSDVNIAHCDLKPENVLLRHPQRSAIKVVDFGASCRISESMFTYVQSRFYRAPEVILGLPYGTQVDVWSLGCMLIELHTGYPVFAGKDEAHQIAIIVERLGLPPAHMLKAGRKTSLFFDRDAKNGDWCLKTSVSPEKVRVEPGSKPIQEFVEYHTETTNGRRKRMSGGHSELDYEIFLSLAYKMLQYDPTERITAEEALRDGFVHGMSTRSGRESPPQFPSMEAVGESLAKNEERDPGRQAPVQRLKNRVNIDRAVVETDGEGSIGELGEVCADVGGKLRLSKSEPSFEPVAKKTFVFKTSDWAEGVGIEPPPWRSGGSSGVDEDLGVGGTGRNANGRRRLGGAGGGHQLVRGRRKEWGEWSRYGEEGVCKSLARVGEGRKVKWERGRDRMDGRKRMNVTLPRGHGNALLLLLMDS